MKRVAIPIVDGKLSEYFGGCSYYEIFEIEEGKVQQRKIEMPEVSSVSELPLWLEKQHITDVIVYKVNKNIITLFASKKVNLFVGVPQNSSDKLIDDYLNGNLESDKNIIIEITN
ncbi:hypothetical protein OU798_18220 [Prolixibacteraceae bacterium Z1-6]|uniref:Dinitrogenase iron-molybdenum cofactor biosynthesis domain-containing protein n=1 Tax=Draconibacterium aestuarii TaxID=2998507 RepID=A0A9X3J886_9BACT|nr:hypothetical protein [Prolixibacteraceae bacterium Z1-6]